MKRIALAGRLDRLGSAGPELFGSLKADSGFMVGVARIAAASTDHFWERHCHGGELLYLLAGRARFIAVDPSGDRVEIEAGAGDVLMFDRNEAHQAHVHEDLKLLFLTPQDGNEGWTDDPEIAPRHG